MQPRRLAPFALTFALGLSLSACDARKGTELVRAQLRDPASAQFREVRVRSVPADASGAGNLTPGGKVVCGEVNVKNAHGGYVGFKRFIADLEGEDVQIERDAPLGRPTIDDTAALLARAVFMGKWALACI